MNFGCQDEALNYGWYFMSFYSTTFIKVMINHKMYYLYKAYDSGRVANGSLLQKLKKKMDILKKCGFKI